MSEEGGAAGAKEKTMESAKLSQRNYNSNKQTPPPPSTKAKSKLSAQDHLSDRNENPQKEATLDPKSQGALGQRLDADFLFEAKAMKQTINQSRQPESKSFLSNL